MGVKLVDANIVVPQDFAAWKLTNPTPQEQIDYFKAHPDTKMPRKMWDAFYCSTLAHKGFHCGSCLSDAEYLGQPNFDDKCCCLAP